jgi:tetratricopeptide (TPR) repeat protein
METETKEQEVTEEYRKAMQDVAIQIATGQFSIRDYYGLNDAALESIYSIGHELYSRKQYEKAKGVFTLLLVLEPNSAKYISACGSSCFMLELYDKAFEFFTSALASGDYTPKTLLRTAECAVRIGRFEAAEGYLKEILNLAEKKEFKGSNDIQIYTTRATMMLQMIQEQAEAAKKEAESNDSNAEQSGVGGPAQAESAKTENKGAAKETKSAVG